MKRFLNIKTATNKKQNGATFVEFAIGFPLLALLILFLVDAGLYLFQKAIVTNATALLNREIVTQFGQREAEASFCSINGCQLNVPTCENLGTIALQRMQNLTIEKKILFEKMVFSLQISPNPAAGFRLVTTIGEKDFRCLTCKFLPLTLNKIQHTSVLVIERPPYIGIACPTGASPDIIVTRSELGNSYVH